MTRSAASSSLPMGSWEDSAHFEEWLRRVLKLDDGKIQKLRDANITDSLSLYYALGCNARCEALRKILGEVKFQKLGTEKEKFISELRSALPKEKRHYDGMPEDEASLLAQYRQEIRNARREKMDKVHGLALRIDHESSLDWVIVMDLTVSMKRHLAPIKSHLTSLLRFMKEKHPRLLMRLGFVGYRDYDVTERLCVMQFTSDAESFLCDLAKVEATGRGDEAEDVIGGLHVASAMQWESRTRILYHIGDAPCHGSAYQGGPTKDNYPDGHPGDPKVKDILKTLSEKQVEYFFWRINNSTDTMIYKFLEEWKDVCPNAHIKVLELADMAYTRVLTEAVQKVLADTSSTSLCIDECSNVPSDDNLIITPTDIRWSDIAPIKAGLHVMIPLENLDEIMFFPSERSCATLHDVDVEIKIAPTYFARGSRLLSKLGVVESRTVGSVKTAQTQKVVLKTWNAHPLGSSSSDPRTQERPYNRRLTCHRVASYLASEFNKVRPGGSPSISYVSAELITIWERKKGEIAICEAMIEGPYEKYSNNFGYCSPCPTTNDVDCSIVHTFSHWTFEHSKGFLLVVDCQGSFDAQANSFCLTDPAIHCLDVLRYNSTNLAEVGMDRFFETHECNAICRNLRLNPRRTGVY